MILLFYSLRIWPLTTHRDDERFTVSHSEEITCFVLTVDSLHVITGSRDMSLKVWHIIGGKLTQVKSLLLLIFLFYAYKNLLINYLSIFDLFLYYVIYWVYLV